MLQVEDGVDSVPQIVTAGSNFSNAGIPQVLTSNLNGQVYVIGNPTEVFAAQAGTRAIAPRSTIADGTTTVTTNIKKVCQHDEFLQQFLLGFFLVKTKFFGHYLLIT